MPTSITVKPETGAVRIVKFSTPCNLYEEMDALAQKIRERAFGLFQQRAPWAGNDWSDWLQAESEVLKPVPIEMSESETGCSVRAEVPGFQADELTIRAEGNSICIQGKSEKKQDTQEKHVKYTEVSAKELCRRIDLPCSIDADKATASLANGVLTINLPKGAAPKKIEVKAA